MRKFKAIKVYLILLLIPIILCISCRESDVNMPNNILVISTFNMSWLGDGYNDMNPRSEDDYKYFAEIISDMKSDIVACQEIENDKAIKKILRYLPNYNFKISDGGNAQKVAIIYKNGLQVSNVREIKELEMPNGKLRPGLVFYAKNGNFDFEIVNIHLKATSSYDNTEEKVIASRETRKQQIKILNDWINNYLASSKERDIIVLGDYNDTPKRKIENTLLEMLNNSNISFITADLKSCGKYQNSYVIDNIAVTSSVLNRLVPKSLSKYDIFSAYSREVANKISDHCPISASFDCSMPDND